MVNQVPALPRRSLILAGGGLKVAFQAGVLQVWLDEAGLSFDDADGASGGTLNLAMYCQGMSGARIADNWRQLDPRLLFDVRWEELARPLLARSIGTLDRLRDEVLPRWGIDWDVIRKSPLAATFNLYNFSKHELVTLPPAQMSEEHLLAAISLPMWFPPVSLCGDLHIDAVFATDGNIEEAIRRGADEVWVIWTVSQSSEWHDGFVAQYFQIIEACANSQLKRAIGRIEENNRRIASGQPGDFGRPVTLRLLRAEVPVHYLLDLSADRLAEVVNLGVQAGRRFCDEHRLPYTPIPEAPAAPPEDGPALSFSEKMTGFITLGETAYDIGYERGKAAGTALALRLTIDVPEMGRFVEAPDHTADISGVVECAALGGELPVGDGTFHLFVDQPDPAQKRMIYRIHFQDRTGGPLTLYGIKEITDNPSLDVWSHTTTLFTRILPGHVAFGAEEGVAAMAAGIVHIHFADFLHQLTTFRARGPTVAARAEVLARFGRLFFGKLWDVYGRRLLPYGPL